MVTYTERPLPGAIPYTVATKWRGILHTTQGSGTTTYGNGAVAPQLTAWLQQRKCWRHYNYMKYAGKALMHPSGTPATNTTRCVQIEIVGFCDDAHLSSPLHISKWTDGDYAYLASIMRQIEHDTGMASTSRVVWKAYGKGIPPNTSAGANNGVRMSWAYWGAYEGWAGHQHVPGNVHGDPGNINISKLLAPKIVPPAKKGKLMLIGTVVNDARSFVGDGVTCRWVQSPEARAVLITGGAYLIPTEFKDYPSMYAAIGRRDRDSDPGSQFAGKTPDPAVYNG